MSAASIGGNKAFPKNHQHGSVTSRNVGDMLLVARNREAGPTQNRLNYSDPNHHKDMWDVTMRDPAVANTFAFGDIVAETCRQQHWVRSL
jgi:hypothetical protein